MIKLRELLNVFLIIYFFSFIVVDDLSAKSVNLFFEKHRNIEGRKKNLFMNDGVFYFKGEENHSSLTAIRYNFDRSNKIERIVFDLKNSFSLPELTVYIDKDSSKIYIDFFNCIIPAQGLQSSGISEFVKDINFYAISNDLLSVELSLKDKYKFDVFYLENPARLVFDVQ